MRRLRLALGVLAAVLLGACGPAGPEFYGAVRDPVGAPEDFTLTDQHGLPYRLADRRGKVVLLFFGYAHCPDVCPVTLSSWARVEQALEAEPDVEFVFVTVDPERDTVERMREHLAIFSGNFLGLTGTDEEMMPVYEAFGIFREKMAFSNSAVGYVVDHSTRMLLLDRRGQVRVSFPFDADPDEIVHDVRSLLKSSTRIAIRVEGAWARPTAGSGPGAAYLSIRNRGDQPDRLLGARSTHCSTIEIHHTQVRDGRMSMAPVEDGMVLDPGATVTLEPGGYHLMLFDLKEPLRVGTRFPMILVFKENGEIPVEVAVRR